MTRQSIIVLSFAIATIGCATAQVQPTVSADQSPRAEQHPRYIDDDRLEFDIVNGDLIVFDSCHREGSIIMTVDGGLNIDDHWVPLDRRQHRLIQDYYHIATRLQDHLDYLQFDSQRIDTDELAEIAAEIADAYEPVIHEADIVDVDVSFEGGQIKVDVDLESLRETMEHISADVGEMQKELVKVLPQSGAFDQLRATVAVIKIIADEMRDARDRMRGKIPALNDLGWF